MKKNNPSTPILIREASNTAPRVWARYELGREKVVDLKGSFFAYLRGLCLSGYLVADADGGRVE